MKPEFGVTFESLPDLSVLRKGLDLVREVVDDAGHDQVVWIIDSMASIATLAYNSGIEQAQKGVDMDVAVNYSAANGQVDIALMAVDVVADADPEECEDCDIDPTMQQLAIDMRNNYFNKLTGIDEAL